MMRRTAGAVLAVIVLVCAGAPAAVAQVLPPERWEADIADFEARDREAPPDAGAVVFVGSSSVRFWATLGEDFPSIRTLNRGFGGSGMRDLLHFVDRIVVPYQPSHVVVYTGENDIARGASADDVYAAYRAVVEKIHASLPGTRITFVSMKPSPSRRALMDEKRRGNTLVATFSATDDGLGYIDVFEPMLDTDGEPRAELFVDDMLHLNDAGYALWRSIIAPHVER
jgi:lysophospholipase L1-like esterase